MSTTFYIGVVHTKYFPLTKYILARVGNYTILQKARNTNTEYSSSIVARELLRKFALQDLNLIRIPNPKSIYKNRYSFMY